MESVTGRSGRGQRNAQRWESIGCAAGLVLVNALTMLLLYPGFTSSLEDSSVGVPLIIAFHLGMATEWLTSRIVRAGLLSLWWYVPPTLLTGAALLRLASFMS